ncbi:MAG: alpha-ketoglutarate-dependent dioxygenase AlkB family protein [Flavobacteriaceae bacterium]
MLELFPEQEIRFSPVIPNGDLFYYGSFISEAEGHRLFKTLSDRCPWQQDRITVYGKTYDQPRLTSLHAVHQKPYTYSNITMHPNPMTKELMEIKKRIETRTAHQFNSVLINLYRNGQDSNGWHADDEPELGKNPVIASLSLGQERYFHLKHKTLNDQRFKLKLTHGSLLIMGGELQHYWQHQIPKTMRKISPRINLTFRLIR